MSFYVWLRHYWTSRPALWGARVIIYSLMVLCLGAAPFMLTEMLLQPAETPVILSYTLIIAALVAHLGFLLGIIHLTWEMYRAIDKRNR